MSSQESSVKTRIMIWDYVYISLHNCKSLFETLMIYFPFLNMNQIVWYEFITQTPLDAEIQLIQVLQRYF